MHFIKETQNIGFARCRRLDLLQLGESAVSVQFGTTSIDDHPFE